MDDIKVELVERIEAFAAARASQNRRLQVMAARELSDLLGSVIIAPLPPADDEAPAEVPIEAEANAVGGDESLEQPGAAPAY